MMKFDGDILSTFCTSISTSLDIGSDLVNSLDFLGFNASTTISTRAVASHTNHTMAMEKYGQEVHKIWGALGIFIIFLPGLILLPFYAVQHIFVNYWGWKDFLRDVLMCLFFPMVLLLTALLNIFSRSCREDGCQTYLYVFAGAEAIFESFTQLILQGFTILYGYPTTKIQSATILVSFVMLARASILFDIQGSHKSFGFFDRIIHTVKILPCYVTTIIFRALSIILTLGYLRSWSAISMGMLYLESVILAYLMFKDVKSKVDFFQATYFISLSNISVINTAIPGFCFLEDDKPSVQKSTTFIRRTSIVTFCHHTLILVTVICLGMYDVEYFNQEQFKDVVLLPKKGNEFYYLIGFTIVLGFYSMVLSLQMARKVANVEVGKIQI